MRTLRTTALCAALLSIPNLHSQSAPTTAAVDPQKAELAREILAAEGFDKLARQVESQTLARTYTVMAQNPLFPRGFLVELSKRMTDRMADLDLQGMILPIYAERFSTDELRQILAFESSPVGQKLASSEASMLAEIQPQVTVWSRKTSQEVTRQILSDHPEWMRQIAENRQKQSAETLAAMPADNSASNEKVYWNARDVQPPQVVSKTEPQYSEEALKAKVEGSVMLSLTVGSDGVPRDVRVVRPLGSGLDEKAVDTVRTWRWKPASKNGTPVATHATIEVNFHLADRVAGRN